MFRSKPARARSASAVPQHKNMYHRISLREQRPDKGSPRDSTNSRPGTTSRASIWSGRETRRLPDAGTSTGRRRGITFSRIAPTGSRNRRLCGGGSEEEKISSRSGTSWPIRGAASRSRTSSPPQMWGRRPLEAPADPVDGSTEGECTCSNRR
jgi:hypothetical protein